MFSKESPLLLSPGPVILHPSIQKSLAKQMRHHRSAVFEKSLRRVSEELKIFFQTKQEVLLLTCTGTGAMEAGLINTLSPGEELICIGGGKFGERWSDMARGFGLKVHFLEVPWGKALDLKELEEKLKKHAKISAVVVTACETSTGTNQPVKDISLLLKKCPDILFIVDAITGLGAMPLPMDEWGIDVMTAGSQKSFWLPAGMAFIALSKKAWDKTKSSKIPKYYFDLNREKKAQLKGQTAFSSPVSMVFALEASLNLLKEKGLKQLIAQCESLKASTHAFCKALDLKLYSSSPSASLTAIEIENSEEIKKILEEKHHVITAGGQGILKNKILRLGHLGPLTSSQFLTALKALGFELNKRDSNFYTDQKIKKALSEASSCLK